jgi:hypothetical protein
VYAVKAQPRHIVGLLALAAITLGGSILLGSQARWAAVEGWFTSGLFLLLLVVYGFTPLLFMPAVAPKRAPQIFSRIGREPGGAR